MDQDDDLRKDIDKIKNDISIIKNSLDTLYSEFNTHIKIEHSIVTTVTANQAKNTTVLDNNINTDISIIDNSHTSIRLNDTCNSDKQIEEIVKSKLIDYSFIKSDHNNKSFIDVLSSSNKNISSYYNKNFLEFCFCAVSLIESIINIFLEKKLIEINNEDHERLLTGLKEKSSPNKAETGFMSGKYVTINSQPLKKTKRNSSSKGF